MNARYLAGRILTFFIVVWVAATVNFIVPRLAPGDPIGAILQTLEAQGQAIENSADIIEAYRVKFGLDDSLWEQYFRYLRNLLTLEMGYSLTYFPARVIEIIARALPWTAGLLVTATMISFTLAIVLGALFVWQGTPRWVKAFTWVLIVLGAIPYYLLAIVLIFFLSFTLNLFPIGGTAEIGTLTADFSLRKVLDVIYHSTLPALSIILAATGGRAMGMRGMMVTVLGEDYLLLAEAKGLRERHVFLRYAVRNAFLPQITGLAISLGHVVSGAMLVEVLFSYPGMGYVLVQAIRSADYTIVQGITFILVVSVAVAVLIIDLVNPKLDPRITYGKR